MNSPIFGMEDNHSRDRRYMFEDNAFTILKSKDDRAEVLDGILYARELCYVYVPMCTCVCMCVCVCACVVGTKTPTYMHAQTVGWRYLVATTVLHSVCMQEVSYATTMADFDWPTRVTRLTLT